MTILCVSAWLGVSGFLGLHTFLLLTNQTTIELAGHTRSRVRRRGERWANPYNLGFRRNCLSVFGPHAGW